MRTKNKVLSAFIFLSVLVLTCFPEKFIPVGLDALLLFAKSVLPMLLPFAFLTGILSRLGFAENRAVGKIFNFLYGSSPVGGFVFLSSVLSGYPVGAKLLGELYADGRASEMDVRNVLAYTSVSGPAFVVGCVGATMLHDKTSGVIIFVCHVLSALINGFFYRIKPEKRTKNVGIKRESHRIENGDLIGICAASAISCAMTVGLFSVLFSLLAQAVIISGFPDLVANALYVILPREIVEGTIVGAIEMTRGTKILSEVSHPLVLPFICAVVSFGGLSVGVQALNFLPSKAVKPTFYFSVKLSQSLIAYLLCALFLVIF